MATKANKFIGIMINDAECRLNGVPENVIAAIGEVLRDLAHVNLENITITVMDEQEIMAMCAKGVLDKNKSTEDVAVDKNEFFEECVKAVHGDLSNKIAINASISDRIKIRIIKGYLREILSNAATTKIEQEARAKLRYVVTMIRSMPVERRQHYCDITDKMFIEAILHLSKEYENR